MSRPLEATSHAVLQAVNDAIISCDIEGVVVTWNREAEALYGYTAVEAIGSSLGIIKPPEFPPTLMAGIEDASSGPASKLRPGQPEHRDREANKNQTDSRGGDQRVSDLRWRR